MDHQTLTSIFSKFAGLEVPMEERTVEIKLRSGTKEYKQLHLKNDPDPVLQELEDLADQHGLTVRAWWPGIAGTDDFRKNRLNVFIEQDKRDGKWKINPSMVLG